MAEAQAEAQQLTGLTASNAAQWVEGARQLLVAVSRFGLVRSYGAVATFRRNFPTGDNMSRSRYE